MPIDPTQTNPVALQVTSRAVDTYVSPAQRSSGGLAQSLASALKDINPALQRYLAPREVPKAVQDSEEAQARAAILANPVTQLSAVKDNLVLAQDSPLRNKFYRHARGEEARSVAEAKLRASYAEAGLANTDDPTAFDNWAKQQVPALLKETGTEDADFLDGFAGGLQKVVDELRANNQKEVSTVIKTRQFDAYANTITSDIETEFEKAAAEGRDVNFDSLWTQANTTKDKLRLQQYPGGEASDFLGQTIATLAVRRVDYDMLEAFKDRDWTDPVTGKTVPGPFKGAKGKKLYEETVDKIGTNAYVVDQRRATIEKQKREEGGEKALAAVLPILLKGQSPPDSFLTALGSAYGVDSVAKVRSLVSASRTASDYVDPRLLAGYYAELNSSEGVDPQKFVNYWLPRIAADKQAVQAASDDLRAAGNSARRRDIESTRRATLDGYTELADAARLAGQPGGILSDIWGGIPGPAQLEIQAQYGRAFLAAKNQYAAQLDSSDPAERDKALEQLTKRMTNTLTRLTKYGTDAAKAASNPNGAPAIAPNVVNDDSEVPD